MNLEIRHHSPIYEGYRAACVRSMFNAETSDFQLTAELPLEAEPWQLGLVVGPSGSGKTSLGKLIFGSEAFHLEQDWPKDQPIIEVISPQAPTWQDITAALSAVGLGSVPAWLRPYQVLSTGEKFRADLARIICEAPARIVIDEFTSVVDRQIAQVGAAAFAKAWRRTLGQAVCLSCHYDIIDWLAPDWIFDTATGCFSWTRGRLRRPNLELEICQTNWGYWSLFEPHHYLKLPHMIAATNYVGYIDKQPVAHVAVSTGPGLSEARACRLVIMPEWQGIGVGVKFLNAVCDLWRRGENRYNKPLRTLFHTSHPGLASALRRHPLWTQVSATPYGGDRERSRQSIKKACLTNKTKHSTSSGYGGHFRAVQGFRYLG